MRLSQLPRTGDSIETHTFLKIVQAHLHPHWWNAWIETNRWGERERARQNFPSSGTLFVGTFAQEKQDLLVIPLRRIPFYRTIKSIASVEYNEEGRVIGAAPVPGWYGLLRKLHDQKVIVLPETYLRLLSNPKQPS